MADHALIEKAAAMLREAAETGTPCGPVRDVVGTATDIDVGYAVQELVTNAHIDAGRRVSGRKIGITSKAVMEQIGVDQPDFGTLFVDMEYGDGVEIEAGRLLQPRAEAEVALVLEHDLDMGTHGFADIVAATAFALMTINDEEVSNGTGAACLGHPLNAARWLADVMCARGTPLRAGDVVMTGALGPMVPMAHGDTVVASFGDLGTVTTSVAAA